MVRKQKPRKIGNTSAETMAAATRLVLEDNYSLRRAADIHNINFITLRRYVIKKRNNPEIAIKNMEPNYSVRQVFTEEQEVKLADYINTCSKMAYGLSTKECRKLAWEMANTNKLVMPRSWSENKCAGVEWLRQFLKRRKVLSIRQPEACSLSRLTSFNPHNVKMFFDNLKNIFERNPKLADASRIFNLDETGTTTVQRPGKIVAKKGSKQVNQCSSAERGVLVTTCAIICANGTYLPPAMVFPRKYFKTHMISGAPPGTLGLATPNGWMTTELFPQVLDHFIRYSHSTSDNPSILVYDNHESHVSVNVVEKARAAGVTILTLPPHSSHRMQPLDIAVFGPFKAHYNASINSWLLGHAGIPMTIYQIALCVGEAHAKSFTPTNIMAGFKKSGIFPFDDLVFNETDFLMSAVSDRVERERTPDHEEPGQSNESFEKETISDNDQPGPPNTNVTFFSPEDFRGYPKAQPRKAKRKPRKRGRSTIITDTPEKDALLEKEKGKVKVVLSKKTKQNLKEFTRRSQVIKHTDRDSDSDAGEENADLELEEFSDNSWSPEMPEEEPDYCRTANKDDFVLVRFNKNVHYVGKLLSNIDGEGDYEVSYLRKCEKLGGSFRFPLEPELAVVNKKDIKIVLPSPAPIMNKRLANYYKFNIDFDSLDVR